MSKHAVAYAGSQNEAPACDFQAPLSPFFATPHDFLDSRYTIDYMLSPEPYAGRDSPRRVKSHVFQPRNDTVSVNVGALEGLRTRLHELSTFRRTKLSENVRTREIRKMLRETHDSASQALSECVDVLRQLSQQWADFDPRQLDISYQRTRALHDMFGSLETEYLEAEEAYMNLEEQQNTKEWQYAKLEAAIQEHISDLLSGQFIDSSIESSRSYSANVTPTATGEQPIAEDGLIRQYKSTLGKLDMLEEALIDLKAEHHAVLEEQQTRAARGSYLHSSNKQFLDDFPTVYEEAEREVYKAEREVERLRQKLFSSPSTTAPRHRRASSNGQDTLQRWYNGDSRGRLNPEQLADPIFRSSQSDGGLEYLRNTFEAIRQRISDWILDNLSHNRLEMARHKAILNEQSLTDNEWWNLVRQYWDRGVEWESDLNSQFEKLRDSYTEYKHSSNIKNLSTADVTPVALQRQSTDSGGVESTSAVVWPVAEEQPVGAMEIWCHPFPPTPPDSVRDSRCLRHTRSTNSIRVGTPPTDPVESHLRKSWSG